MERLRRVAVSRPSVAPFFARPLLPGPCSVLPAGTDTAVFAYIIRNHAARVPGQSLRPGNMEAHAPMQKRPRVPQVHLRRPYRLGKGRTVGPAVCDIGETVNPGRPATVVVSTIPELGFGRESPKRVTLQPRACQPSSRTMPTSREEPVCHGYGTVSRRLPWCSWPAPALSLQFVNVSSGVLVKLDQRHRVVVSRRVPP